MRDPHPSLPPACSAYPQATTKLPVQDDAVLSVRVQGGGAGPAAATRVVRTSQPPAWAPPGAALPAITYSGAYPLSRLDLSADPALGAALASPAVYAYSPFKPGAPEDAAHPAAAFSLAAANPAGEERRGGGGGWKAHWRPPSRSHWGLTISPAAPSPHPLSLLPSPAPPPPSLLLHRHSRARPRQRVLHAPGEGW